MLTAAGCLLTAIPAAQATSPSGKADLCAVHLLFTVSIDEEITELKKHLEVVGKGKEEEEV